MYDMYQSSVVVINSAKKMRHSRSEHDCMVKLSGRRKVPEVQRLGAQGDRAKSHTGCSAFGTDPRPR